MAFNLLDARGAVSVTERAGYLARIRNMARSVAKIFVAEREKLGFPLLCISKCNHKLGALDFHQYSVSLLFQIFQNSLKAYLDYFLQLQVNPVTSELTYGLERLASYIQEVDSVYDLEWSDGVK
jgi:glycyl-tRNA synthetase alpha subunit